MIDNERVEELQKFVDDFREKIRLSSQIYESKILKNSCDKPIKKNLRKSQSQVDTSTTKILKLPLLSKSKTKTNENNILSRFPIWKPGRGFPDYFEKYKRLIHKKEMSDWEIVSYKIFLY